MDQVLDIHPGYFGRQHLVDEYRLLGSALAAGSAQKPGERANPSMRRWQEYSWAAYRRFLWIRAEIDFRGITLSTPALDVQDPKRKYAWPNPISSPAKQFGLINEGQIEDGTGRIPLPRNSQQLWAQHKYSVMARDANHYRSLGPRVARLRTDKEFMNLAEELTGLLRLQPSEGGLRNALQHMWGHVSGTNKSNPGVNDWSLVRVIKEIKCQALTQDEKYLLHSTALTELQTWLPD